MKSCSYSKLIQSIEISQLNLGNLLKFAFVFILVEIIAVIF